MIITIAKHSGFCFGVQRALDITEGEVAGGPIYTIGPVIHNPIVVSRLEARGAHVVTTVKEVPRGSTVVVRSHGMSPEQLMALRTQGARIVDATCPLVKRAQQRAAELAASGYLVVIVGDRLHPEVAALKGCAPGSVVIESTEGVPPELAGKRIGVVSQTSDARRRMSKCGNP